MNLIGPHGLLLGFALGAIAVSSGLVLWRQLTAGVLLPRERPTCLAWGCEERARADAWCELHGRWVELRRRVRGEAVSR